MRVLNKKLWPYKIKVNDDEYSVSVYHMETWLGEQLGILKGRWTVVYHHDRTDFYFRTNEDAVWFKLRWA